MKYCIAIASICIALTGCGRDHYYTKAGCVTFATHGVPESELSRAAQLAALSLGYKLVPADKRDQFVLHFRAKGPDRAMMMAGGLKSDTYFISADVYDAGDQIAYGLDPGKLFDLLKTSLGAGSFELESSTCPV